MSCRESVSSDWTVRASRVAVETNLRSPILFSAAIGIDDFVRVRKVDRDIKVNNFQMKATLVCVNKVFGLDIQVSDAQVVNERHAVNEILGKLQESAMKLGMCRWG